MREFESPEKQKEESLTNASDLYSLGVIGLTLYGVSFSTNLKITKPIHCPFGLYEKLKALTNLTPSSRPPLDEIIDALDFETNPGSFNNIDSQADHNKKSALKDDQASNKSKQNQKDADALREANINPQIISQKNIKNESQPSLQFDAQNVEKQNSQAGNNQNSISANHINNNTTEQKVTQQLQPKSEKIIFKQEPEKIEYDFNPFKFKQGKEIQYTNPMKRIQFYQDHEALITQIISDKNNGYILTSSLDGTIIVYQYDSSSKQLKEHKRLNEFAYGVSQVLITKDNNYIVAADLSSNIYIYSFKDFKLHKKITNLFEKSCILSIDVSDDNKELLVSATYKNTLLCSLNNFERLSSNGNVCRFYQNNIVIGEESGKLLVYSKDNLITPQKELNDHNGEITQISIGQDAFAVSSQDKSISIYDKTFKKTQNISNHVDCVANVTISNDDTTLTSNGWDGTTCLFNKNSSGQFELKSSFPNETSWSVSSIYIKKNNAIISTGGRFLFIFA